MTTKVENTNGFQLLGAELPAFCAKCGLVKDHEVHHGRDYQFVWGEDAIRAHNFKRSVSPQRLL